MYGSYNMHLHDTHRFCLPGKILIPLTPLPSRPCPHAKVCQKLGRIARKESMHMSQLLTGEGSEVEEKTDERSGVRLARLQ